MNRIGVSLFCLIVLCAPMCPAFAQEAALATRENKIIALQQEASLYFESGQYELAFLSLDKLYTTSGIDQASEQLEEASLYKARCKYHLSQAANEPVTRKALLEEARQLFAHNLDKYPERRFYPANLYWQGRTLRDLASVSEDDEQRQNLVEASQQFSSAKPFLNGSDLKFDNSYYYAITMGEIGDLDPELPERNQIYAEAVMALEKLILNYPEHPQRSQAEFQLLRYLFKSQKYEQALDVCVRFQKKFPLDKKLTEVCFFGAESLYYVGRLMEAVEGYDKVVRMANQPGENAKNLIIDALYGKAWSFARLANTAGKERHRHYLGEASLALREVLADMPPEDPRYQAATYKYAESLVALGDYKQAQISLRDIINLPQYRMRANYLAGSAALLSARKTLEPQAYQEAYNYFNNAYQLAREAKIYDILLPSLHNLVAIELSRGRYEEAVSYSQEALEYAKTIRDVVATAKSQLDKARGLIALVQTIGEADEASMAASIPPPAFHALPEYNPEIMVTLEKDNETTSSLREQTPTELLLEAKQILEMLLGQHDVQNRLDETYYYQGCALFEEAKIKSREFAQSSAVLPLGKESLSVVNAFEKVDSAFDRSFSANPRGIFATRVHYAQAHVGRAAGILFQHIADRLLKQGDRKSAQIYRDRSLKQLVNARDALLRMLNLSSPPPEQHNAQALLGCVYQDLNRPLEAEQVFREFLKTPEAAPKLHTFATLRLVEVLEGRARIFDAVEVLSSYLAELSPVTVIIPSRDNAICTVILQLGAYQEEIGKLAAAYQTLLLFTRLPQSPEPAELQKQIEGNYRAHTLGMKLAQTLPSSKEPEDLVQASIQGLENISAQYPDSKWAALSLEAIAQHHLDSKDAARAMAVADLGLARLPKPASQLQMLLLKGKIFFTQKDYPSAIREYRSALELHPKAIAETRMLARNYLELAMALSAQAKLIMNAEEKQKTFEQAIDTFAAVWAKYPEEYTAADQSRIAAAEALKQAGRIEEAATILGGMYDKRRSANLQRRLTDLSEDTM